MNFLFVRTKDINPYITRSIIRSTGVHAEGIVLNIFSNIAVRVVGLELEEKGREEGEEGEEGGM